MQKYFYNLIYFKKINKTRNFEIFKFWLVFNSLLQSKDFKVFLHSGGWGWWTTAWRWWWWGRWATRWRWWWWGRTSTGWRWERSRAAWWGWAAWGWGWWRGWTSCRWRRWWRRASTGRWRKLCRSKSGSQANQKQELEIHDWKNGRIFEDFIHRVFKKL